MEVAPETASLDLAVKMYLFGLENRENASPIIDEHISLVLLLVFYTGLLLHNCYIL
jgi:hypothetical protein